MARWHEGKEGRGKFAGLSGIWSAARRQHAGRGPPVPRVSRMIRSTQLRRLESIVEDYKSAAIRHFEDAMALRASGRIDNAGHLVGFAAECAIKFKILNLRPRNNSPHGHFPDLLIAARKHLGERANFSNMYNVLKGDVFANWNVNRRYYETGNTSEAELSMWLSTTKRLFATAGLKVRK